MSPAGSWVWYGWSNCITSGMLAAVVVIGSSTIVPPLGLKFMNVPAVADARDRVADGAELREVAAVGLVAGGAEVGHALSRHRIDGLRDQPILEEGFVEEGDVVHDDVGLGRVGQGE